MVDVSGKKRDLKQLMVDGVRGANGQHAQGPAEEVLDSKNVIVTIQSKLADFAFFVISIEGDLVLILKFNRQNFRAIWSRF